MANEPTPEEIARAIIDGNRYMTLATADHDGRPWPTPVYYTPHGYEDLYWASSPQARHSLNIAQRTEIGIVVFDSTVEVGHGAAVYMEATAGEVDDAEIETAVRIAFTPRFAGITPFTPDELRPPAPLRLYRAVVSAHSILKPHGMRTAGEIDSRIPVSLG